MPRRLGDLEMSAHLIEVLAGNQLLVALGELVDDLIRRRPPALTGCHGAALHSLLTGKQSHNTWTTTRVAAHRGQIKPSNSGERLCWS